MRWLSADCVMCSSSAACEKLRVRAAAKNASSCKDGRPIARSISLSRVSVARPDGLATLRSLARAFRLDQQVTVGGGEIELVHPTQRRDLLERVGPERRLALECVQDDALEQVAEREVVGGGHRLEDLEHALLHPHAGLHALDLAPLLRHHRSGSTKMRRATGDAVSAATS